MKLLSRSILAFLAIGYLSACSSAPEGQVVEGGETKTNENVVTETAKDLTVDVANSNINWVGSKVTGEHSGTMAIKSGTVKVEGENIVGGEFVLDMTSITVTDLEAGAGKEDLEGHLKTGDFFEVEKYPEGKFEITKVRAEAGAEGQTHIIEGNLTLKDIAKGVEIPAAVTMSDAGLEATTPQFTIDRTLWEITYEGMKDDLINNMMGIKIKLAAK